MAVKPKKRVIVTVGGVPWDDLSKEEQREIIQRNTDVAERIISSVVVKMAKEGKSLEEIKKFLRLTN